jgi:hypothetical protein
VSESESYVTTDGELASLSWNIAPISGLRPVAGLFIWGALSDEWTGLSFTIAASTVIFGSEARRTLGHNLLSQIRDFLFRRPLRLAGCIGLRLHTGQWVCLSLSLTLRPKVTQALCLGIKLPSGAYGQNFIIICHLQVR